MASSAFVCGGVGAGIAAYNATTTYLGCYKDPSVSILSQAKLSTIAMTPQYCGNYCGERGYAYGGVEFGTQCFCGSKPNFSNANKTSDSDCRSKCATDMSKACGATYVMSLYQITNPVGNAPLNGPANPPACLTNPFCSHPACDQSKTVAQRVAALVKDLTLQEKIYNLIDSAAGSTRLGLPAYEWWSEATHGVGSAPGTFFPAPPADFNHATSFPSPILTAASFDADLFGKVGKVVGVEGRAFGNYGFAGFDFWAPNMNPFRDPRWGRGQETPGEDTFVISTYVRNFVAGLQGNDPKQKQVIATCKHYAVYDLETGREQRNYNPTQQDLAEYFLAPFKTCVRDSNVGSVMCSYNAVDGIPACANQYLLDDVLRKEWNFTSPEQYVVSDCSAVTDIWVNHNYTNTEASAAALALNAGVDLECGTSYLKLNQSLVSGQTNVARLDQALTRLYTALFSVGFFDGGKYEKVGWSNVATKSSTKLAYTAAAEGMVLLKNDGTLPLKKTYKAVALIGPFANATTQMQGDYSGTATYLRSPLHAFQNADWKVLYAMGTGINTQNTTGFATAVSMAKSADVVVYCGGIDNSLEAEGLDRNNITWPGNQLDLISQLTATKKPVIVAQFGAGQVDDTPLLKNKGVKSIIWAGYPSQDGGTVLRDIITGHVAPAGRLPITQYPGSYSDQVNIFEINLRPNMTYPGRTYKWYNGEPVFPFGYGLHYTKFSSSWKAVVKQEYKIEDLVQKAQKQGTLNDQSPFETVSIRVKNIGETKSDYVGLLFISSLNAGPSPRPNKSLVAFSRANGIQSKDTAVVKLELSLGSLSRADSDGNLVIYPGKYQLGFDIDGELTHEFSLTGKATIIESFPKSQAH